MMFSDGICRPSQKRDYNQLAFVLVAEIDSETERGISGLKDSAKSCTELHFSRLCIASFFSCVSLFFSFKIDTPSNSLTKKYKLIIIILLKLKERDSYVELWQNACSELEKLQEIERVWIVVNVE